MASDGEKQIRNVSRYIRGVLKKDGRLRRHPGLPDRTGGHRHRRVQKDTEGPAGGGETVTVTEFSREGDPREKPHPLLFQLREQSKVVSKGLDLLMMNIKSKKGKAEAADSFAAFMSEMGKDD